MEINKIVVGLLQENCYILEKNDDVLIVDPGDEYQKIKEKIKNKKVLGVLLTHRHPDHIGALKSLISEYQPKIYDDSNTQEKEYKIKDFTFYVLKTYGHTNDSISYYFKKENIMFTGDFVFKENIGRTDLPTGNYNEMQKSIIKLKYYNNDIIIYPGHGQSTTLDYEKKYNIYFNM